MKEKIREIFLRLGTDLCGVADVGSFSGAPKGFHPADVFSDCKSVIVFAKPVPKGTALVSPRIIYQHYNTVFTTELDRIAYSAALEIEENFPGAVAVPLPADGPYEYWDAEKLEGRGTISMKHAAVLAGLGTLGKSSLLLNSRFGNMLSIGAVLTNLALPSDKPAESICIESCRICIENCPVKAISENGVNQKLCRPNAYAANGKGFDVVNCNRCRILCPMAFGKSGGHR